MIKGKVQQGFRRDENGERRYEFKTQRIELLSEVRETKVKAIKIDMPLALINEQLVSELEYHCKLNKGNANLEFNIFDPETKTSIQLFSRNIRVDPNDKFLDYLKNKEGFIFKIN
jgi:DNA polymerase-3 subunit alpha